MPFSDDYPVLLASFSVYQKHLPNLSTIAGYEAELAGVFEPIRNGEIF